MSEPSKPTSKLFKLLQVAGALLMAGGVASCTLKEAQLVGPLFLLGGVLYAWGRLGAWLKHG